MPVKRLNRDPFDIISDEEATYEPLKAYDEPGEGLRESSDNKPSDPWDDPQESEV